LGRPPTASFELAPLLRRTRWITIAATVLLLFGCADFLVLLGLDHMYRRYVRFFLGGT